MSSNEAFTVRRRIALQHPAAAAQALRKQDGVLNVEAGRRNVRVRYDRLAVCYGTLLELLRRQGLAPAAGWLARLRTRWFSYLDANAQANAAAPSSPCCGNPREIYANRRR